MAITLNIPLNRGETIQVDRKEPLAKGMDPTFQVTLRRESTRWNKVTREEDTTIETMGVDLTREHLDDLIRGMGMIR